VGTYFDKNIERRQYSIVKKTKASGSITMRLPTLLNGLPFHREGSVVVESFAVTLAVNQ
jgi:hypothetical protein